MVGQGARRLLAKSLLTRTVMSGSPNFIGICKFVEDAGLESSWNRSTVPVRRNFRKQLRQDPLFWQKKEEALNLGPSAKRAFEALLDAYDLSLETLVLRQLAAQAEKQLNIPRRYCEQLLLASPELTFPDPR